jgi:succinate-acetate transporter protein
MAEERPTLPVADPAPLGLGAFALTTFILSATNAFGVTTAPLLAVLGFALFYGGLAQFVAGMWEFRNRNVFGATAFSTYGGFWLGVAVLVILAITGKIAGKDLGQAQGWILLAFAIFNTYMLLWSTRINVAVFAVFLTLEVTEILLFIGNFAGNLPGQGLVQIGGYVGLLTALVAWYTSAAGVINGMSARPVLPVGGPLWGELPAGSRPERPLPRVEA